MPDLALKLAAAISVHAQHVEELNTLKQRETNYKTVSMIRCSKMINAITDSMS